MEIIAGRKAQQKIAINDMTVSRQQCKPTFQSDGTFILENLSSNGTFTSYLIRGLRSEADTNQNRVITANELFLFVNQNIKEKSNAKQHPVMWGHFDNEHILMDWIQNNK